MKKHHEDETRGPEAEGAPAGAAESDKIAEAREQMLRLRADFENAKKRLERDKADAVRFANEGLLLEVLHVVDDFDRAAASLADGHDPEKVREGLRLAQDKLHKVLERHGVKPVESAGGTFDPALHEAVAVVETDDPASDGRIVDEIQRGYTLNGRLLRPSRVRIAQRKAADPH